MPEMPRSESLRPREKLPAVEVDSVVIIVNQNIATPFKFVEGEKSDMGFMLSHDTKIPADKSPYMIQVDVNH